MKVFPCAKINLGLNVVSRRPDGYHNLETAFLPIPLTDILSLLPAQHAAPNCSLDIDGQQLDCGVEDNLVVKAYNLVAQSHHLPSVKAELTKRIPTQAGLGGGSSDAAFMIRMLNERFALEMTKEDMRTMASKLGADCAFFIDPVPSYATGIGEVLTPIPHLPEKLQGLFIAIVKPPVAVSTKEAFSKIQPKQPKVCCKDAVGLPIEMWKDLLSNDFEESVFPLYPQIAEVKAKLYQLGALYAQMSGSGSSVFAFFKEQPAGLSAQFNDCFTFSARLH